MKNTKQMFQIQACDNSKPHSNNWLAYDGAEFDEELCEVELAASRKRSPRYSYKKILSGSCGGNPKWVALATQNYHRPMREVLDNGDDMEIQSRFDQQSRDAFGKLYSPSQRWACTLLHRNGSICSVDGPFDKTKAAVEKKAKDHAEQFMARCWVFSRRQTGCKLVSVHYWDDKNQFVISRKV
ncbi:MAG: hypothetical protein M0R32_09010 [Candidatus Cloacimonetes bacterium]|jgi:hypothetical protein|nr:hypothetical protein [Candidatus Cloacimonadota bacterium]